MHTPNPEIDAPDGWPRRLLDDFRAGRRAALGEVYRRHAPEVAGFLRAGFSFDASGRKHRFSGFAGAFELQDALQETFRLAFEPGARQRYDGVRPYGPYLRAIARNVVLRGFRAREVLFPTADGAGADTPDGAPDAAQVLYREQIRRLVADFLAGLDPVDRELLTLRFADGVPQREAADRLGIGRQRLRAREARLRGRLLAHLRAHGETAASPRDLFVALVAGLVALR